MCYRVLSDGVVVVIVKGGIMITCEVCENAVATERIDDWETGDVLYTCEECVKAIEPFVDEELARRDMHDHWKELYEE